MTRLSTVALLFFLLAKPAWSGPSSTSVYSNDFEGAVGSEWSQTSVATTPTGRRFLGEFVNNTVTLSLSALPSHSTVEITFDLFIINSWDGNQVILEHNPVGPDEWDFRVAGEPDPILHTTFSQQPPPGIAFRQAYPDPFPIGNHPARTGAAEVNTLGYGTPTGQDDSVYQLTFSLPHTAPTISFQFSANGLQPFPDESWGIDNVAVTVDSAPSGSPTPTLTPPSATPTPASCGAQCTTTSQTQDTGFWGANSCGAAPQFSHRQACGPTFQATGSGRLERLSLRLQRVGSTCNPMYDLLIFRLEGATPNDETTYLGKADNTAFIIFGTFDPQVNHFTFSNAEIQIEEGSFYFVEFRTVGWNGCTVGSGGFVPYGVVNGLEGTPGNWWYQTTTDPTWQAHPNDAYLTVQTAPCFCTPTPTPDVEPTATSTPTPTPTATPTATTSNTATATPTFTPANPPTSTPTSTPTNTETLVDTDGDGLPDVWETDGIDGNDDGVSDYFLPNAHPRRKDVYVEIDWMPCHKPDFQAIADVVRAFRNAPPDPLRPNLIPGIALHVLVNEEIDGHIDDTKFDHRTPIPAPLLPPNDFRRIRRDFFGTRSEREERAAGSPILDAKLRAFRYGLFAHKRNGGSGGTACRADFIVALGSCAYGQGPFQGEDCLADCAGSPRNQASVLMHELGHTLGLRHGGPLGVCDKISPGVCSAKSPAVPCQLNSDCSVNGFGTCTQCEVNCKPNYLSIMSYSRALAHLLAPHHQRLDYSRLSLLDLDERHLDETLGLATSLNDYVLVGPRGDPLQVSTSMDWDGEDGPTNTDTTADVNNLHSKIGNFCNGASEDLRSFADWQNMTFAIEGGIGRCGNLALLGNPEFDDTLNHAELIEISAEDLPFSDTDGDGIADLADNCFDIPNTDQADSNWNSIGDACEGSSFWEFSGSAQGGVIRFSADGLPFEFQTTPGDSAEDVARKVAEAINTSNPALYGVEAVPFGNQVRVNVTIAEVVITDPGIGHRSAPTATPVPALSFFVILFSVTVLAFVALLAIRRRKI